MFNCIGYLRHRWWLQWWGWLGAVFSFWHTSQPPPTTRPQPGCPQCSQQWPPGLSRGPRPPPGKYLRYNCNWKQDYRMALNQSAGIFSKIVRFRSFQRGTVGFGRLDGWKVRSCQSLRFEKKICHPAWVEPHTCGGFKYQPIWSSSKFNEP